MATSAGCQIGARKDFVQQRGVTPPSPLNDRIKALKGARIGVGAVTRGPTQSSKYLLKTNGIDPETEVQCIIIGQGAARVAGVRTGQADVFLRSGPEAELAEHEGFGELFIYMADVPVLRNSIWITLAGKKD